MFCRVLAFATAWAAVLAIVAPSARAACLPVPTGVTGWWPLEADAQDLVSPNAGVVTGGALFATGEVAQGMVFHGVNDGVRFEPSANLNVGAGGGFTVELWMKPDAVNELQPLLEWNNQGTSIGTYLWYAGTGLGTLDGDLIDTAGVEHPLNAPVGTIVAGVWQHVAMTYDRASGLAVLYRNGTTVLQHNWGQMTPQTSWQLYLGSRGSYRFKGMMDEVTLFNRALSPLEIQSIYDAGSAGKCGSNVPPTIFVQPASLTRFVGSNVTFNVLAGGSLPLAYQWFVDGVPATDGLGTALTLTNLTQENAGDLYVVVTNVFGAVTSAVVTLTITEQPAFDLSRDFSVASNPGGPWSYGWVGAVGGAFSPLTAPHATATPEGAQIRSWQFSPFQAPAMHHNISSISGTSDGGAAVYPPGSTWVAPGENGRPENFADVRFTLPSGRDGLYRLQTSARTYLNGAASGDADYHVVINGIQVFGRALPGNSSTDYTNTFYLSAADTIDFVVGRGADNNLFASALILDATLHLVSTNLSDPIIVASPQSQTVITGGSARFTVVALGSALSYQWTRNGVALTSATNAMLTLSNVQSDDSGDYVVIVSNSVGPATSAVATLLVAEAAFDVGADYSSEMNPGPVWSYGWKAAIGGTFTLLTYPFTINHDNGVPVTAWALGGATYPIVYHNGTTNTAIAAFDAYSPGTTWFHPGFENTPYNFGVIRCTIPTNASGSYRLESKVLPFLAGSGSGDCDYHVALNGAELFGQFLAPRAGTNFSTTLSLSAGDTVDFLIGRGADGVLFGSGLKLDAQLLLLPSASNTPPAIIFQPQSRSVLAGASVAFGVAVNGSLPFSYQWRHDGTLIDGATNATLTLPNVLASHAGHYSVEVTNTAGSAVSADAVLTVIPSRTLALQNPPAEQEGSIISVPLSLISDGDVGGMTFNLDFNTAYLRLIEWEWSPLMAGAFSDLNTNTAGRIRASFALPATAIPAGDQPVATLRLLLRSVPNDLDTSLTVQVIDVSGPSGDPITVGNQTRDASLHVTKRLFIGDNNANQRLDVGDATTILRLLAFLDTSRSWDIPANDLNTNNLIDTGDAIRVLRAAAGIDPQPGGGGLAREAIATFNEKLVLMPATARGDVGTTINFEVRLQDLGTTIAGAAFTLDYPTNALRLVNLQSYRAGSTVPDNALAVWNVSPGQNNFVTQNGHLSLAASSANQWSASNGALAVISFQVQPGASNQYAWPLLLRSCEVTPDGYANRGLQPYGSTFIGRSAIAARLEGAERSPSGLFQFTIKGDAGARYTVLASSNLIQWSAVTNVTLDAGGFRFIDADSSTLPRRFYRALQTEP